MVSRERFPCPCCHALTIGERAAFEICQRCGWEDDGQNDTDAEVVRGGPNGGLSLATARLNYVRTGHCGH
ncbi:CPCC family cysteine-rich protein [Pararhizobium sp.]|uniref:CPCC family cysteine-rich protein n=1 Tax=Pararhizobium sp. TaxID=1977563 RepID=UPI003D0E7391